MIARTVDSTASAEPDLSADAQLKLVIMRLIDARVREGFNTLQEAAGAAGINRVLLSRIRAGDHRRCSIAALLAVAERLGVRLRIEVRLAEPP
jgi:hypothetical protein